MTRRVIVGCDRCGQEDDLHPYVVDLVGGATRQGAGEVTDFDLCGACAEGVRHYLGGDEMIPRGGIQVAVAKE